MSVEAYPLTWPAAWTRTPAHLRQRAKFNTRFGAARDAVLTELRLMGVRYPDIVISSNVPLRQDGLPYATAFRSPLADPGIAIYFIRDGQQLCFACDKWTRVEDNLQSIRKTIEALRGIERWGSSDLLARAFAGFEALPAGGGVPGWWDVLDVSRDALPAEIDRAYRAALKRCHPDVGGDPEAFHAVQEAYRQARGVIAA